MFLTSAAVVAVVALLSPLALRLSGLRLPGIVLQIILGILIGPEVLGVFDVAGIVAVSSSPRSRK
jgi:hypothetical protein